MSNFVTMEDTVSSVVTAFLVDKSIIFTMIWGDIYEYRDATTKSAYLWLEFGSIYKR